MQGAQQEDQLMFPFEGFHDSELHKRMAFCMDPQQICKNLGNPAKLVFSAECYKISKGKI